ncbi:MAG: trehalase family glycosidase [Dehalococcoidales bacterium]|nr:trehalase family glycosidase [Dehalococcoidales bacterium]
MFKDELSIIDENSFAVSSANGDMMAGRAHGLFYADTRFLSAMLVRLDGQDLHVLSSGNLAHNVASVYATNRQSSTLPQGALTVVRDRFVSGGLHEDIAVANHLDEDVEVALTIDFAADFADIFEARGGEVNKAGTVTAEEAEGYDLAFVYRREDFVRKAMIAFSQKVRMEGQRAVFKLRLAPKEGWRTCLSVQPVVDGKIVPIKCRAMEFAPALSAHSPMEEIAPSKARPAPAAALWLATTPRLKTHDTVLCDAYRRAVSDLAALGMQLDIGQRVPAAGLPWYMAIFGRDTLITSLQTLLLGTEMPIGVLRTMAHYQSRRRDDFRDEQPGKIPHEVRSGELASLGDVPHSRYYGTADATPLFVVLLSEVYRWTHDRSLVLELLPAAEKALGWIDNYGDMDGDGFVEYKRKTPLGLPNQGWKDSEDSMCFADGRLAEAPIALAEVQGYVYDAKMRMAELYRSLANEERAAELERQAGELRSRFNDAFWMADEGYYALALDAQKRQVTGIASNPGHCLWSGIVDPRKAEAVVQRLMAPDLFSGWGIRTLSTYMRRYNPISYHNGSVWPHDNSLIAAGLLRHGFRQEAARVAQSIMEASAHFPEHRLPELFAGYPRRAGGFPINYPDASSPQAWAAGSVILLLQTLLGARPRGEGLSLDPLSPALELALEGVPFLGGRLDIRVAEGKATVSKASPLEPADVK